MRMFFPVFMVHVELNLTKITRKSKHTTGIRKSQGKRASKQTQFE